MPSPLFWIFTGWPTSVLYELHLHVKGVNLIGTTVITV